VHRVSTQLRREMYAPLFGDDSDYQTLVQLGAASQLFDFAWIQVDPESPLAGETLGALGIRARTGATVVGVMREGQMLTSPGPDTALEPHDLLAVAGTPDQRRALEGLARAA
jgi:CPA2 family monovalent cation:H+ antiporter-2